MFHLFIYSFACAPHPPLFFYSFTASLHSRYQLAKMKYNREKGYLCVCESTFAFAIAFE